MLGQVAGTLDQESLFQLVEEPRRSPNGGLIGASPSPGLRRRCCASSSAACCGFAAIGVSCHATACARACRPAERPPCGRRRRRASASTGTEPACASLTSHNGRVRRTMRSVGSSRRGRACGLRQRTCFGGAVGGARRRSRRRSPGRRPRRLRPLRRRSGRCPSLRAQRTGMRLHALRGRNRRSLYVAVRKRDLGGRTRVRT